MKRYGMLKNRTNQERDKDRANVHVTPRAGRGALQEKGRANAIRLYPHGHFLVWGGVEW